MKLDMSKAYDRVEWILISKIMEKLGFVESWIIKIMACIESVHYVVVINGSPQGSIIPQRRLRQGDPLSPYLFLFCVENLYALLNQEERLNHFRGLKINKRCPSLSHLFFCR